jgi:heme-degrading monooxygenase HmoA
MPGPQADDPLDAPVLEHALLPVARSRAAAFEQAFAEARPLVAAMPGFRGLHLSQWVERPGTYLLLVGWDRLGDHTEGFRRSPQYARWRALLHDFYEPFPVVEHLVEHVTEQVPAGPAGP